MEAFLINTAENIPYVIYNIWIKKDSFGLFPVLNLLL
jgi:hypothetical protein